MAPAPNIPESGKKTGHVHSPASNIYRREIDGLRALAIIPVVLFHAGFSSFRGGFVGVDIFFVISGYLITGILYRESASGSFSVLRFYERRVRRIFPALFFMIAVSAVVSLFILLPGELAEFAKSVVSTATFSSNILFWRQEGYFDENSLTKPLLHTWSLAVEEQFYILFPFVVAIGARFGRRFLLSVALTMAMISLLASVQALKQYPSFTFYMLPTRAWELLLGSVVALLPVAKFQFRSLLAWAAVGTILATVLSYSENMPFPGLAALPPCAATACILWTSTGTTAATFLSWRPIRGIGLISYSLYLWHWPIIVFLGFAYGIPLPSPVGAGAVLVSLFLAWASWAYVERPLRETRQIKWVWGTAIGCIAASLVGATAVYVGHGFPARFSKASLDQLQVSLDNRRSRLEAYKCNAIKLSKKFSDLGPCWIGTHSEGTRVIILGDSHAMAMKQSFDQVLKELGISGALISIKGCPPILGWKPPGADGECEEQLGAAFRYINDTTPSVVILVGRWRPQLGLKPGLSNGESEVMAERLRLISTSLENTVAVLQTHGSKVGVLLPVPGARLNPGRTLARGLSPPLTYSEGEFRASMSGFVKAVKSAKPDAVVDLASTFCVTDCRVVDEEGNILFADESHLSARGAERVLPQIRDIIISLTQSERVTICWSRAGVAMARPTRGSFIRSGRIGPTKTVESCRLSAGERHAASALRPPAPASQVRTSPPSYRSRRRPATPA